MTSEKMDKRHTKGNQCLSKGCKGILIYVERLPIHRASSSDVNNLYGAQHSAWWQPMVSAEARSQTISTQMMNEEWGYG